MPLTHITLRVRNVTVLSLVRHSTFVFSGRWGMSAGLPGATKTGLEARFERLVVST